MRINLPSQLRAALYMLTVIVTPVIAVLTAQSILPEWVNTLWAAEVAAVTAMAALNVSAPLDK